MRALKEKIIKEAYLLGDNILKVDSFLNHRLDIKFFEEIAKEFRDRFNDVKVDKILTIEASGIAIASICSIYFDYVPVVFAKKTKSKNLDNNLYIKEVYSYTKATNYEVVVSKKYINRGENILIIDDFLANGKASKALVEMVREAGANVVGVGIVIEKSFQEGKKLLENIDVRVESLVKISSLNGEICFKE